MEETKKHSAGAVELGLYAYGDRIIVLADEAETVTKGGIIIPDAAQEKSLKGTVIVTGPGLTDQPMTVAEGARIVFGKYAGTELDWQGKKYAIMRQNDILARILTPAEKGEPQSEEDAEAVN